MTANPYKYHAMKHSISLLFLLLVMVAGFFLTAGCSDQQVEELLRPMVKAPGATIERTVKGHEQIASVQAILRLALPSEGGQTYNAYGISTRVTPPIPVYQQIDISKNETGRIVITSGRKHFDVVKSKHYYYALELKYYDVNGKLINHQFGRYDPADPDGSTIHHHQHFFALQNYSLTGQYQLYPMTLDSLYISRYTLATTPDGHRVESTLVSPTNIYLPIADTGAPLRYHAQLAQRAIELSTTKHATDIYRWPVDGREYRLYKSLNLAQLNEYTREIFTYTYRDTDPIEDYLGAEVEGVDDLGRQRVGKPTQLLQQQRRLGTNSQPDYLGFKGVMQFAQSHVAFQMRVCIAHILSASEKYLGKKPQEHHEISPSLNTFDIDYPLAFRVIADADGDAEQMAADVRRFYPEASAERLKAMFANNPSWVRNFPTTTV